MNRFLGIILLNFMMFNNSIAGQCDIYHKVCLEGAETRLVDGFSVTKDCWKYEIVYECKNFTDNNCSEFRDSGCEQIYSKCKYYENGKCVGYELEFKCLKEIETEHEETVYEVPTFKGDMAKEGIKVSCDEEIKCIDGKCFNQTYDSNNEIGNALAMLHSLKEMEKQYSTDPLIVFKGEANSCRKKTYGTNNCCKAGKSFMEKAALSTCSAEERALYEKRANNLCHFVGDYKHYQFGIKKYSELSFCCFDSALVKQIHTNGRIQYGRGFGTVSNPDCGGLTVEELQKIDFSKIDFSSVIGNIANLKYDAAQIKDTVANELNIIKESVNKIENDGLKEELKGRNKKFDQDGLL